ncbi:MAG: hypothetical protein II889_11025 [Clostridia bacterium]|nr:hypothetical protein [Clostridia bacterium]MCR4905806.1 DUF6514 family protein [Clostridiales bacterium]
MTIAIRDAAAGGYHLTYRLEEIPLRRGKSYDIAVRIESVDGAQTSTVHDVSRNRAAAQRLFQAVADGLVTPCTLADVLEDLL